MMNSKQPEILAPAGSFAAVTAAMNSGADAVYLGQKNFSARASAANFDHEELREAVSLCHRFGAKVYQTVNTLIFDEEIPALRKNICAAAQAGVDAFIVQDLGVAELLKEWTPDIPLHASTQMSVTSLSGVLQAAELGFRRAVLARELTLSEITFIAERSPIDLEVFIHGALCMSVSGQCALSAMIGTRSANRGSCAQPCRLPFSVSANGSADLSLKDLCALDSIQTLAEIGIASFKIEGRMKRPEYVGAAVRAVRDKLNGAQPDLESLRAVFSRSGFTNGYLEDKRDLSMFGVRTKEDVAAMQKTLGAMEAENKKIFQRVPLSMSLFLEEGQPARLEITDDKGNRILKDGTEPERALNSPTDAKRAQASLGKLGGTPYYLHEFQFSSAGKPVLPVSGLNALRRSGIEALDLKRGACRAVAFFDSEVPPAGEFPKGGCTLRPRFASFSQVSEELIGQSAYFYLPIEEALSHRKDLMRFRDKLILELPRVRYDETELTRQIQDASKDGFCHAAAQNAGHFFLLRGTGLTAHGFFGLNVTNSYAIRELWKLGGIDCTLSFETKLSQAERVQAKIPVGLIVYGTLPLMIFRNCPVKARVGCGNCGNRGLVDRLGNRFPISCDGTMSELFNSLPLEMSDRKREFERMDFGVLYFTTESDDICRKIWRRYQAGGSPDGRYTRGLYYRGVE